MNKPKKFLNSISHLIDDEYITICPLCDKECTDYFCRECQVSITPKRIKKKEYIVDRAIWCFGGEL